MVKLVKENLNSFVRNQNPKKALELGYEAKIRNFFRQYNILDTDYEITEDGEIIFKYTFDLQGVNINYLPNNLTISGSLYISYTQITELPINLVINGHLWLMDTLITELPDDLIVLNDIWVYKYRKQQKLINFIENSKFKNKLKFFDES